MMAWTVSGRGSRSAGAPGMGWWSRTMRTYSSANRGLPPAAASRAGPTPVGSRCAASRVSSRWPVSDSDSGSSSMVTEGSPLPGPPGGQPVQEAPPGGERLVAAALLDRGAVALADQPAQVPGDALDGVGVVG